MEVPAEANEEDLESVLPRDYLMDLECCLPCFISYTVSPASPGMSPA